MNLRDKLGKTFIVCTYDITEGRRVDLTPETHPDMPCMVAMRMSANLPFVFDKYRWGNSYYVDGGLCNNFPIDIGDKIGENVLGFNIVSINHKGVSPEENSSPLSFFYKLLNVPIIENVKNKIVRASDRCTVITLEDDLKPFFNFDMSPKDKLDMFSSGYKQMRKKQ